MGAPSIVGSVALLALASIGCSRVHRSEDAGLDAREPPRDAGARDAGRVDAPPADVPPDAGRVCVPSCTEDAECAASCPVNPLGALCCDVLVGVCYAVMTAECPVHTVCPPTCVTDADCATCPPSWIGGAHCCDPVGGRCYLSATATCPVGGPPDGGICPATCSAHADCAACSPYGGCCDPATGVCYVSPFGTCPLGDGG